MPDNIQPSSHAEGAKTEAGSQSPSEQTHEQTSASLSQADSKADSGKARIGIAVVLLALTVVLLISLLVRPARNPSTNDAQVDGHTVVMSPRISGWVQAVLTDDNRSVRTGQVLVQLDPADYIVAVQRAQAALAIAQANSDSAHATVPYTYRSTTSATSGVSASLLASEAALDRSQTELKERATAQLDYAKAQVRSRDAESVKADRDVERTRPLAERNEISKQQFDQYVAAARVAREQLTAAQEQLRAAEREEEAAAASVHQAYAEVLRQRASVRQSKAAELQTQVQQGQAESALAAVKQAEANLEQAKLDLSYTKIVAPVDGVITRKQVEPGQKFAPGQAMFTLVPLRGVWVTANFKETQLARIRPGQRARILVDAYPHRTFWGTVDSIASSTGDKESLLPPENATGNYVKVVERVPVKVWVDDSGAASPMPLRPGMNVEITIETH